jgi:hypothetical protein
VLNSFQFKDLVSFPVPALSKTFNPVVRHFPSFHFLNINSTFFRFFFTAATLASYQANLVLFLLDWFTR